MAAFRAARARATVSHRIAIIQGHPDPGGGHLCHALAEAYARGAQEAGHEVRFITVADLDFPLLRTKDEFENGAPPPAIAESQRTIAWADHLLIVHPLWVGTLPALVKGFFEQVLRPGFAAEPGAPGMPWRKALGGRSARIVVTMGMPAFVYRWYFRAHGLKTLKRNILGFCGIAPIRATLIGAVETASPGRRRRWMDTLSALGRRAR